MSTPSPAPQRGNPFLQSYTAWADRTPIITRSTIIAITITYILSWLVNTPLLFGNFTVYTLFYFEIYRLLLSIFCGDSFLTLIFAYLAFPSIATKMESTMGSSAFLYLLVFATLLINVVFNIICLMFYFLGATSALLWPCLGFWTLLFVLITIDCWQTPDVPRRLLFIPYDIPSKYLPFAFYVIISLFSGFVLAYAVAILVGIMWVRGHLDSYRPSSQYLESLENEGGRLHYVSRSRGWVLAGTLGHDPWIPVNTVDPSDHAESGTTSFADRSAHNPVHSSNHESTQPFPGSGRKLTDSSSTAASTPYSASGYFALPVADASFGGTVARPPVAPVVVVTAAPAGPTREELAARRLAALESQQRPSPSAPNYPGSG